MASSNGIEFLQAERQLQISFASMLIALSIFCSHKGIEVRANYLRLPQEVLAAPLRLGCEPSGESIYADLQMLRNLEIYRHDVSSKVRLNE